MSNIIFPHITSSEKLKPLYKILNSEILSNSKNKKIINLYQDPEIEKLELLVSIDVPKDIEEVISKHENFKNSLKCILLIESRKSLFRKKIILDLESNSKYVGRIDLLRSKFVEKIEISCKIVRDKTITKPDSSVFAGDKGSLVAFTDQPLIINIKQNDFSDGMRIVWSNFEKNKLINEKSYYKNIFFLKLYDHDNFPTLYLNEAYQKYDKPIFSSKEIIGARVKNKKLFEMYIYQQVMSQLLRHVLNKLKIHKELNDQKKQLGQSFDSEDRVVINDVLFVEWEKNIIRDFGKCLIPQANNDDDAVNEIEDKINKGEIDTLIDNIDLAVQLKDKSFKIFEDYYDTLLGENEANDS